MKKIYKSIIIRIFKIIHGEINSIYKSKNFEKISLIKNKKKYVIYQIPKCRIYTDTIHDTSFLYKNQIIPGASFQIRKNANSNIKNNSIFTKGTPRILKNITGPLLCMLTGGGGNNNNQQQIKPVILDSAPTEAEVSQSAATEAESEAYDLRKTKKRGRSMTRLRSTKSVDDKLTLGKPSLLGA